MISEKYLPLDSLLRQVENGQGKLPFPLEYTLTEIEKIKKKLPKSYDKIARVLALSRPIVSLVLYEMDFHEVPKPPHSKGRPRLPTETLILIHLLAQTFITGGYRQTERLLNAHPTWLKALKLNKAPSHTTMSKFRTKMGAEFFDVYFHELTRLVHGFGLIQKGDAVIIDSAPVKACQNFARSNGGIKIDEDKLRHFFSTVDFTPAVKLIAPACTQGRKRKYSNKVMLMYIAFEKLCGFLSRNQALTYLKKHSGAAKIVGFASDDIPSTALVSTYLERMPPIPWLMRILVEPITEFFDAQEEYNDSDPLSFFFRTV
jgi:hypothetical protein